MYEAMQECTPKALTFTEQLQHDHDRLERELAVTAAMLDLIKSDDRLAKILNSLDQIRRFRQF